MKSTTKAAYGDFQTPPELARAVCEFLVRRGLNPARVVEPTCGQGTFLVAAAEAFPRATRWGLEIDEGYARRARRALQERGHAATVRVGNAFRTDWAARLRAGGSPVLVLGNPPWVTSAELSVLGVDNLPNKSNHARHMGLDARTGKANFDVSEWILQRLLRAGQGLDTTVAMLVKATVARRLMEHALRERWEIGGISLHRIDARQWFGATVDAGLFCFRTSGAAALRCPVFPSLEASEPEAEIAVCDGRLVADVGAYERAKPALGEADPRWRSGIKHDCVRVMELRRERGRLRNGLGEAVDLEEQHVLPLLKSSDLRGDDRPAPRRWLVLPQRRFGESTELLADEAPRTWAYLQAHADALDARRSSIYRNQPRFAVFGLGPYSFAPWKIAISGLYKRTAFTLVGPDEDGRPTMLDDTCYFIGFDDERTARGALERLRSEPAQAVLRALVFPDAKRPVTKEVLDRIDLRKLATHEVSSVDA